MILNKAENESQTQVANHFFFFYYLLCVAPPTLSRRTRQGKNALPVPPSKLNLTRQTRSCAPCFVCLQKKKKMKKRFPCSGMRSGDGNIYLTYSPSEYKQASAILLKVIFLLFGLRCTDSSHYSKSQGRDASARDGAPSAHLNEAAEQQLRNKKSSFKTNGEEQLTSLRAADSRVKIMTVVAEIKSSLNNRNLVFQLSKATFPQSVLSKWVTL